MKALPVLLAVTVLAATLLAAACTSTLAPTATPTPTATTPVSNAAGFEVHFQTGSIPPPFDYIYQLQVAFDADAMEVTYQVQYQLRDGMTDAELAAKGYSKNDDIDWTGRIVGEDVAHWRAVLAVPLGPIPPQLPGSDSFSATIHYDDGPDEFGVPTNRADWQVLIDAIDRQARTETGNPRDRP